MSDKDAPIPDPDADVPPEKPTPTVKPKADPTPPAEDPEEVETPKAVPKPPPKAAPVAAAEEDEPKSVKLEPKPSAPATPNDGPMDGNAVPPPAGSGLWSVCTEKFSLDPTSNCGASARKNIGMLVEG
jgi:hypothetical protein